MTHFSDEAWLDFARGLVSAEETSRMQAHLDAGCDRCAELYGLWAAVREIAVRDRGYSPDESAISAVMAAYSAGLRSAPAAPVSFASLVFDSLFDAGALAGVRSISASSRHLLYQSGQLAIDVRTEPQSRSTVTIVGQVLHAPADTLPRRQWNVTLMRSAETVAQTATNEFGEFYFECSSATDLQIRVETEGQQALTLVLPD